MSRWAAHRRRLSRGLLLRVPAICMSTAGTRYSASCAQGSYNVSSSRVPVLIGDGIPLFGALPGDIRLRHVMTRHYPSGLVQSEYRVCFTGESR